VVVVWAWPLSKAGDVTVWYTNRMHGMCSGAVHAHKSGSRVSHHHLLALMFVCINALFGSCTACSPGFFQPEKRSRSCVQCPPATWTSSIGQTHVSSCISCTQVPPDVHPPACRQIKSLWSGVKGQTAEVALTGLPQPIMTASASTHPWSPNWGPPVAAGQSNPTNPPTVSPALVPALVPSPLFTQKDGGHKISTARATSYKQPGFEHIAQDSAAVAARLRGKEGESSPSHGRVRAYSIGACDAMTCPCVRTTSSAISTAALAATVADASSAFTTTTAAIRNSHSSHYMCAGLETETAAVQEQSFSGGRARGGKCPLSFERCVAPLVCRVLTIVHGKGGSASGSGGGGSGEDGGGGTSSASSGVMGVYVLQPAMGIAGRPVWRGERGGSLYYHEPMGGWCAGSLEKHLQHMHRIKLAQKYGQRSSSGEESSGGSNQYQYIDAQACVMRMRSVVRDPTLSKATWVSEWVSE
jgi:hypothetical protein